MNGNRVANRHFQAASKVFYKGNQKLLLQGMIHWGTQEYFHTIQEQINACDGIILLEDTHYLDPSQLVQVSESEFDTFCRLMKKKTNKVLEMMSTVLGLLYQWDTLKYPGPPHAICADVSWRESYAFDAYVDATANGISSQSDTKEATWDLMIASESSASMLLNEILYRCFKTLGKKTARSASQQLWEIFTRWGRRYGFQNVKKAQEVFSDLLSYFGSEDADLEPEQKAFWLDKREGRVLAFMRKIESLDYIDEILVIYGSGHFDALRRGVELQGWKSAGHMVWTTAFVFPSCTDAEMMKTLDAITAV